MPGRLGGRAEGDALGHVAQVVADDPHAHHGGRHADRPDHIGLVGVDLQQFLPQGVALLLGHGLALLVQLHHSAGRLCRLAALPAAALPPSPEQRRPAAHVVGQHVKRMGPGVVRAVVGPHPDLKIVVLMTRGREGALQFLHDGPDPKVPAPLFGDVLGDPREVDEGSTDRLDLQNESSHPVAAHAVSLAVALLQPQLVEHPVGTIGVELRVSLPVFLAGRVGHGGRRTGGPRLPQPQPEDLVELVTVDADRQGDAEVPIGQPMRHLGVAFVRLVKEKPGVRARLAGPVADTVVAALLVLQEHGNLFHQDVAALDVVFARNGPQVQDLQVLGQAQDDPVDVGKLVAVGVDDPVIGVSLEHHLRRVDRRLYTPRGGHGAFGVQLGVVLELEQLDPGLKAFGLDLGIQLGRIDEIRMELLDVVSRREGPQGLVAPCEVTGDAHGRQFGEERVIGLAEADAEGMVIDPFPDTFLTADPVPLGADRIELLVLVDVLVPEQDVGRREGMAVGPPHALAQMKGEGLALVGHVPGADDPGRDGFDVGAPVEQMVVLDAIDVLAVGRAREAGAPRATVPTDLVRRRDHRRLGRQALLDRRQRAGRDALGEHGRFGERRRDGIGVVQQTRQACSPRRLRIGRRRLRRLRRTLAIDQEKGDAQRRENVQNNPEFHSGG